MLSTRKLIERLVLAASLVAISLPASAQEEPLKQTPKGTLTIGWTWDPGTMDPQMHRARFTQIISQALRDKLYYLPPPGLDLAPQLAEGLTQVDDTTYDLKIRQGVRYHNGDEMTSDDVVYTFERLWDPATKSPRASMGNMANVESATKTDRYTVRFKTKVPFGSIRTALQGLNFSAQEIMHKASDGARTVEETRTATPIGAGPFKLTEWTPDQRVVMDAFPEYWQGAPGVEKIIWRTIPEESTRVAELLSGSIDMIYPVTPDFVDQLRSANMKLEIRPGASMRMLQMNVREGSPFADVEVRKAMNMAIDKNAIVEHLYNGLAITSEQVAGFGQEGFKEGYDPFPYDPEAAGAVLSKVTEPVELITQPAWELPAQFIAEQLRGLGMNVTTKLLDLAAFNAATEAGDFTLALANGGYGTGEFVGAYYNNHFECSRLKTGRTRTGFCDPALDEKYAALRAELDPVKWQKKLDEINQLLTEVFVPWVPVFVEAEVWAMQPYVNGFTGSSAGQMFDLHKVTLDK